MLARWSEASPLAVRACAAWIRERKLPAAIVCAGCLLALGGIAWQLRGAAQSPLFSVPLHPAQTEEVERALSVWNESFSSGPKAEIFVSAARRRDILLRLTLAGLPHGYVPTSADVLADAPSLLLSPAAMDDRRRAGIQGDLTAGLRQIDGIADAMVVIAPISANPLDDGSARSEPSASVQLLLQPGAQLTSLQVAGIARFVAAGYPGLAPQRVAIVDGSGRLQAAQNVKESGVSRELRLQNSIQTALDAVLGAGAAVVRVTIRANGGASSTQATRIYPHGFLESETGSESGREKERSFQKERAVRRYAYDTIIERRSSPPDAGARIAVAVFLDAARVGAVEPQTISELVHAAAGADASRGDQVVVRTLPFTLVTMPAAPPPRGGGLQRVLLGVALGFVAALAACGPLAKRWRRRALGQEAQAAAAMRATLEHELPQTAAYVLRAFPQRVREHVLQSCAPEYRSRIEWHLNGRRHD